MRCYGCKAVDAEERWRKADETGDGDVVNISHRRRREEDDGRWEWDGLGVRASRCVCV